MTRVGFKHSEETKRKMSESRMGRHVSEETRRKISEAQIGKYISPETRKKMSLAQRGNKNRVGATMSPESRKKISEYQGGNNPLLDTPYYVKVHLWVAKQLGKPKCCESCKSTEAKRYEWSNKSQNYLYDLSDWQRLCSRCHRAYDRQTKKKGIAHVQ